MKKHERDVIREWTRLPGFRLDGPVLERLLDWFDVREDGARRMAEWLDAKRHEHKAQGDHLLANEIGKLLVTSRGFDLLPDKPAPGEAPASAESPAVTGA